MKKSVLAEEGLRRMRNCARGLDGQVVRTVMGRWAKKLRRSGYPQSVRHQVIKEALDKYKRMCEVEDSGGRQVHRARKWQKAARRLEKERKLVTWHKGEKGQISAPLIIDPTPGDLTSSIKQACRKFEEATNIRVAVKLRAGRSVKSDAKSEPLRRASCSREDCLCCGKGKPGGCERNSVGYRITCASCQEAARAAVYEGESGRNAYSRGLEHQNDLRLEVEDSPLWKHCQLEHLGVKQTFYMEALRGFSSCLQRQVNEAVRITSSKVDIVMNSKSEFHQAPIVRVTVAAGLEWEQGEEEEVVRGNWRGPGRARGRGVGRGRGPGRVRGRGAGGGRRDRQPGAKDCTFTSVKTGQFQYSI